MKRFFTDKIKNMRDVGGYALGDNKCVKEGKIIRSNCATNLNDNDLNELTKMGFSTIIDLRCDNEIEKKNGVFLNNKNFQYHHIGLNGDGKLPDSKEEVVNSYIEILNGKEQIKEIFELLNTSNGGVIYYCSAGKDRTGVVTACILKLLGVEDKYIVSDYVASGEFLKDELIEFSKSVTDKDIFQIVNPVPNNMTGLLSYINQEYGSMEAYLKSCGISDETLDGIKKKYVNINCNKK